MESIPKGRYTREFRQEAVKLVMEKVSCREAAENLSLAPSTLAYWIKAYKEGKLGDIGVKSQNSCKSRYGVRYLQEKISRVLGPQKEGLCHEENTTIKEDEARSRGSVYRVGDRGASTG